VRLPRFMFGKRAAVRSEEFVVKRWSPEERYKANLRKQQKILEDFASHESEWAEDLLLWYQLRHEEIPDDEYRGVAYFINKEYQTKAGSLTMLYKLYNSMIGNLPAVTRELAFDLLAFRFYKYGAALTSGGY